MDGRFDGTVPSPKEGHSTPLRCSVPSLQVFLGSRIKNSRSTMLVGMVAHSCNLRRLRWEDPKLAEYLGYVARLQGEGGPASNTFIQDLANPHSLLTRECLSKEIGG